VVYLGLGRREASFAPVWVDAEHYERVIKMKKRDAEKPKW